MKNIYKTFQNEYQYHIIIFTQTFVKERSNCKNSNLIDRTKLLSVCCVAMPLWPSYLLRPCVARLKSSVLPLRPAHRRIPELSDETCFSSSAQY